MTAVQLSPGPDNLVTASAESYVEVSSSTFVGLHALEPNKDFHIFLPMDVNSMFRDLRMVLGQTDDETEPDELQGVTEFSPIAYWRTTLRAAILATLPARNSFSHKNGDKSAEAQIRRKIGDVLCQLFVGSTLADLEINTSGVGFKYQVFDDWMSQPDDSTDPNFAGAIFNDTQFTEILYQLRLSGRYERMTREETNSAGVGTDVQAGGRCNLGEGDCIGIPVRLVENVKNQIHFYFYLMQKTATVEYGVPLGFGGALTEPTGSAARTRDGASWDVTASTSLQLYESPSSSPERFEDITGVYARVELEPGYYNNSISVRFTFLPNPAVGNALPVTPPPVTYYLDTPITADSTDCILFLNDAIPFTDTMNAHFRLTDPLAAASSSSKIAKIFLEKSSGVSLRVLSYSVSRQATISQITCNSLFDEFNVGLGFPLYAEYYDARGLTADDSDVLTQPNFNAHETALSDLALNLGFLTAIAVTQYTWGAHKSFEFVDSSGNPSNAYAAATIVTGDPVTEKGPFEVFDTQLEPSRKVRGWSLFKGYAAQATAAVPISDSNYAAWLLANNY